MTLKTTRIIFYFLIFFLFQNGSSRPVSSGEEYLFILVHGISNDDNPRGTPIWDLNLDFNLLDKFPFIDGFNLELSRNFIFSLQTQVGVPGRNIQYFNFHDPTLV